LRVTFAAIILFVAAYTPLAANGMAEPAACLVSIEVSTSTPTVAVGEEFDLIVELTNNSTEIVPAFQVYIGHLSAFRNFDQLDEISFMDHFQIIDSHHPNGRVALGTYFTFFGAQEKLVSYLIWFGYNQLSHEWLQPGQTATLNLRLRAIGNPGVINIPVQYNAIFANDNKIVPTYQTQGAAPCYDTDTVELTVTEGSLQGPLLVQKTLLANDLYECIRLGEEVNALWQVTNTSNTPITVRLRDVIPGYLSYLMNNPFPQDAYLAAANGNSSLISGAFTLTADRENGILRTNPIQIPPQSTLIITDVQDVSIYAANSMLSSTVYVWETDENGLPETQPGNAISFTNTPIPVCEPIVTKTAIGDYCDVEDGATINYQVDVDRIIWGSIFAYTIFDDLHPVGTSYASTASANNAGPLYENTTISGRTLWTNSEYDESQLVSPTYDGNKPLYVDKLKLTYDLTAGKITDNELINTFTIRNGSANMFGGVETKLAVMDDSNRMARRTGAFLGTRNPEAAKLADLFDYPSIQTYYDGALDAGSASHSLFGDCIVESYTIDGYKFNDLNGNGVRDGGEPGIESWMIIAQSSAGTFTAVTDAEGYYRMEGLPGAVWQVREIYQLGWIQSAPAGEGFYNVALSEQVQSARLDFGNWKPASISGIKYHDIDGSGRRGEGESGVEGVRIELRDSNGKVVDYTLTDADGLFAFDGVAPGHYAVYELGSGNTLQSQPGPPEGGFYYIVATSGGTYVDKDFGNYTPVSIMGQVSQVVGKAVDESSTEEHDSTVRDARDLKVQLVRMGPTATDTPIKVASEVIELELDENGSFGVGGLQPGEWQVSVVLAEYWSATTENPVNVFIPSGGSAEINFGVSFDSYSAPELRLSSITGSVYRNTTADHLYNKVTDMMVTGQTVLLNGRSSRGGSIERSTTTGNDGTYRFAELPEGEYVVSLSAVSDTLRRGWPNADGHRVILGEDEHLGSSLVTHAASNVFAPVDNDLPWRFSTGSVYANLTTRFDDNGDDRADRRNFFSGPAQLARTSAPGEQPMRVAHKRLSMAGTDSLGRSILANGASGGSLAILGPGAGAPAPGLWTQGLDLTFVLEGSPWYGPTAVRGSTEPDISATATVSEWLSVYKAAEFVAKVGNAPVVRDPFGRPMTSVLSASYVLTPGPDFGLTPVRFFATGGGTGSGGGGIGTNDPGDRADVPTDFALGSAYPNPFNPSTVVPFELALAGQVRLAVYDLTGRQVAVLVNTTMAAGRHTIAWDASGLPSGVYVIQLRAGGKVMTGKATLLK
jgi:hypothetical protein